MPVDVTCTNCAKKMRVPDTAAGKRIKCPKCQAIIGVHDPTASTVPVGMPVGAPVVAPVGVPVGVPVELWHLKTDDGQMYGPISRADLDLWYTEGRLNLNSQVLRHGGEQWQWATDLYPQLDPALVAAMQGAPAVSVAPTGGNAYDFSGAAPAQAPESFGPANPFDFTANHSSARSSPTTSSTSTKLSDKSKVVAGLLGIFLGGYGIHNFYLGFTNRGVTQLVVTFCTCGLGGIWGFIEGIQILTGSINRDSRGRKLRD